MQSGIRNRRFNLLYAIVVPLALCVVLPASGQQQTGRQRPSGMGANAKDRIPSSLEDRLAAALAKNPDIRAAQARSQAAEAELNRIRLEVTKRVVAAHNALDAQKIETRRRELQFIQAEARYREFAEANEKNPSDLSKRQDDQAKYVSEEARHSFLRERAQIGELEAELRYLLGRFPKGVSQQTGVLSLRGRLALFADLAPARDDDKSPMLERIRKPLTEPLSLEFTEASLADVLLFMHDVTGVQFVIQPVGLAEEGIDPKETNITVAVRNIESVATALTVIQDLIPELRFVVRDYGILVTGVHAVEPGPFGQDPFAPRKQSKEK